MIAIVHGPRGCGKTTALRRWLVRRGWMPPRGYRTFFDGDALRLAPWTEGAPSCEIMGKPAISGDFPSSSRPCPPRPRDPAYAPALDAFLDSVFYPPADSAPPASLQIQPPQPAPPPPLPPSRPPWAFDASAYWRAALATLEGDPARPLVIDELGLFETLPGALDPSALKRLLDAIYTAPRAILVVQERALGFWLKGVARPESRQTARFP